MCVVDLKGDNVRSFLRGLVANNVDKLQVPGGAFVFRNVETRRHSDRRFDHLLHE